MEKSGITRRIDNLGRIVIPKEIRKNLKIKDADELEINIVGDKLVLKKYDNLKKDKVISCLLYTLGRIINKNVLFTSRDKILDYFLIKNGKIETVELDDDITNLIESRKEIINEKQNISFFEDYYFLLNPLIINGDLIGSIIIYGDNNITGEEKAICKFSVTFLENYLE